MTVSRRQILAGAAGLLLGSAVAAPAIARSREKVAQAALDLLESIGIEGREAVLHRFDDSDRRDWHYTPRSRPGLTLKDMSKSQRERVFALLQTVLSDQGAHKVNEVIRLEGILGDITGNRFFRDPENYAIAIFGDPAGTAPWAWRFEGHHLSLSFTVVPGKGVAATPAFFGTNPAVVRPGHRHSGLRVLKQEHDIAFALVNGLTTAQRETAILQPSSFGDILTGPGREDSLRAPQGLALGAMNAGQRDQVLRLIQSYVANMRTDIAERELRDLREAGIDRLHFAWAGGTTPDTAHYYRLHGPSVIIEYDNTQNGANHAHSVWHDPRDGFGADLLRQHHERDHR